MDDMPCLLVRIFFLVCEPAVALTLIHYPTVPLHDVVHEGGISGVWRLGSAWLGYI